MVDPTFTAAGLTTVLLVTALILWILIAGLFFARLRAMRRKELKLSDLANLFDSVLAADPRSPIWVWDDGRVHASSDAVKLLALSPPITHLDDIFTDGTDGLPLDMKIRLRRGTDIDQPAATTIPATELRPAITLEVQNLTHKTVIGGSEGPSDQQPTALIWVSSTRQAAPPESAMDHMRSQLNELGDIIDGLPLPVWLRDRSGQLIRVNEAYREAVGAADTETVLSDEVELFGQSCRQSAIEAIEEGSVSRERQFSVVAGQRRGFSVIQTPIGGHLIVGICIDVTGEEEALAELSRVLDSQSETLNRLRTPVAIFGPNRTLRFFNSAFQRLSHLSEEFLESDINHGELLDALRERRRLPEQADFSTWKREQLDQYTNLLKAEEQMWYFPDGSTHRVVTQPHPFGGLLLLFEDVTDSLALERLYNTLIAVQRASLDNIREAVAVFGPDGRLRLANPAFSTLWQLPEDLTEAPHLSDLVARLDLDESGDDDGAVFRDELPAWVSARQMRTGRWHRGEQVFVDFALVPLPDGAMMLTQLDVTDSVRAELALRERSRALEVSDKLKSEFVTNMAYGLRTPLNTIIGFSEILREQLYGTLNSHQSDYVGDILSASYDLRDMITNVLDIAVIDSGNVTLDPEPVDIAQLATEAGELAQTTRRNVKVAYNFVTNAGDMVLQGDRPRLKQMIYNMLSAALDIGQFSGEMSLAVTAEVDFIDISITDLNVGLVGENRAQLITTLELGGVRSGSRATGLDLALVRSVASLHKGSVGLFPQGQDCLRLNCRLPRKPAPPDSDALSENVSDSADVTGGPTNS